MTTIAGSWMQTSDATDTIDAKTPDPSSETRHLFDTHGPALYRFCRSTLGHGREAEDIVQDTFVKLLKHLRAGGDRSNLRAWLFAVAANACRDRARWRMRWLPWSADQDRRVADPPDEAPDRSRAYLALDTLAPRDRLLLSLRAQGLSYREVAAAAGIAEASVGRLLARAVARWKRAVARSS